MRGARKWIAFACVAGTASCGSGDAKANSFPLRARTIAILEHDRPYDARLSPGHRYMSCVPGAKAGLIPDVKCNRPPDERVLANAAAASVEINAALANQSTTDALWSAALLDLWSASADVRMIDRAIYRLLEVSARDTGRMRAAVLNDLAVAHLVRASARDDPRDLFAALEYAERAYARDSASVTVRFNRAIVLERAGIDKQATDAWRALADSPTPWGHEAEERYRRLASAMTASRTPITFAFDESASTDSLTHFVERDPQMVREYVLDTLIPRWADAVADRQPSAAKTLDRVESIGRALLAHSGDSSVLHVADEMARDPRVAVPLVDGAAGAADFRATHYVEAGPKLAGSVRSLRQLRASALADWIELILGGLAVYRADYANAESTFSAIAVRAGGRRDVALEARSNWGLALSRARRGAMSDVEPAYRIALSDFERIGETSNQAFMNALVADIHSALGRTDASARDAYAALTTFHRRADAGQRYGTLLALGHRLSERGEDYAAAAAVREGVLEARATGRVKDMPEALSRLASEEATLGDGARAKQTMALARERLSSIDDSVMHARIEAEVSRAEARVDSRENPRLALARWNRVAAYFVDAKIPSDEAKALVARAAVHLTLGDSPLAERDLSDATAIVGRFAGKGSSREVTRELVATQRDAYRQLVAVALARGDTGAAYEYAMLSRTTSPAQPHLKAMKASTVPAGTAVLDYLVLDDRTLLWTTTAAGRRLTVVPATRAELTELVAQFVNLIQQGEDTLSEHAVGGRLERLLLHPVRASLEAMGEKRLVLVADGPLAGLPFAALRDLKSRYLVQDFALSYAASSQPGSAALIDAPRNWRSPLFVGNPAWDRALFPELDELRRTGAEIQNIGALYTHPLVLGGPAASRSALLREIGRHDLIHFAGHARVIVDNPGASHLVLARDTAGFGANVLYASDIANLHLDGVRLVVLSACGESRDPFARSEGNGLVQAFLDAGAGAVIASQWEADDDATAELTRVLHRELRSGTTGDEALRRAQLALLGGAEGRVLAARRMWSGFRLSIASSLEK
jgi:CHAT domain-containing protein